MDGYGSGAEVWGHRKPQLAARSARGGVAVAGGPTVSEWRFRGSDQQSTAATIAVGGRTTTSKGCED